MSSPTSRPEPVRLSTAEQAVLSRIAAHEHGRDTRFADALARGEVRRIRRGLGVGVAMLAVLAAMAFVVGAFVLPGPWLVVIVAVGVIVVVPTGLVVWAIRQGTVDPDPPPGTRA